MVEFEPIPGVTYKFDYPEIFRAIASGKLDATATYRKLCREDLFFLLYFGLEQVYCHKDFVVNACREVDEQYADTLDLWAREHFKSTIKTYAKPIQQVLNDPEQRICIFSHTRPIAKGFLRQIKQTLEDDVPIKAWFPEIFYKKPKTQAPKWSEDDGLVVKRKSKSKEGTFEAWGLVDGQPISKHYTTRIYDDIVTKESTNTPEMIKKTVDAYELSQSLGTDGGIKSLAGTFYHFADLYVQLEQRGGYIVRKKPATHDGTASGRPVMLSPERLAELKREQGPYVFSCQQLLNPVADENQEFKPEWLKYYGELPSLRNKYITVDPAGEKKKDNDYTVMAVQSIDGYGNHYLEDLIRARLQLQEKWAALLWLWQRHAGAIKAVGYEKYGMQSDNQYFEEKQREAGIYFQITELGGNVAKFDRIRTGLIPIMSAGRYFLPPTIIYSVDELPECLVGIAGQNMVKTLLDDELLFFPFSRHDDILDCLTRIKDKKLNAIAPSAVYNITTTRGTTARTDYRDSAGI